ncbi:hypothetical protein Agub_g238 [Astrephomene gubernaculifera]|uniref:Proline dehydrogenase n=1 Tax=Astrephomene gubernaculifera TaxID=47775 RepID=A0AAD3HFV8_9CHLO|nr:hypothetical protein Agub_g238 [Astrephomene gubernaculifera]
MQVVGSQPQVRLRASAGMQPAARLLSGFSRAGARRGPIQLQVFRNYGFEPDKETGKQTDLTFTVRKTISLASNTIITHSTPSVYTSSPRFYHLILLSRPQPLPIPFFLYLYVSIPHHLNQDHAAIFEGRSTADLLRALLVLRLCASPPFVSHSEALLDTARRLLGDRTALDTLVGQTFYKHFCVGKEPADVWARMNALRAHGIGAILDYAEEEDLLSHCKPQEAQQQKQGAAAAAGSSSSGGVTARDPLGGESLIQSRVSARTYDYQDEDACERHTAAFLAAIDTAATLPGQGFAAIKLSALGDPALLQHLSDALSSIHLLFRQYDVDGDGVVTRAEFEEVYQRLAAAQGLRSTSSERSAVWGLLDSEGAGQVDYVSWTQRLDVRHLPELAASLEAQAAASMDLGNSSAPSSSARPWLLSPAEQSQLDSLLGRLERLVARAVGKGVKLMVDAEQSLLQPAIDHIALHLMREHNQRRSSAGADTAAGAGAGSSGAEEQDGAVIFLTYQAYLRDAHARLQADLSRAEREGYVLGAKLVRGAYLHLERRHAAEVGRPSPVWDRIEQTHGSFDACLDTLFAAVAAGRAELMIGSHNQSSVEGAVGRMTALGLDPSEAPVYFGQLMGMADNLSFTLGQHGYKVFKYCPYGSVDKVIPYLLRRVNENQYVLKGGKQDVTLLWAELRRRALQDTEHSPLARLLAALPLPRLGGGRGASA